MNEKYKNKSWLYDKYINNDLSSPEIGQICNRGSSTIAYWLKKFKIKKTPPLHHNKEWLYQKYWTEGLSSVKIARICNRHCSSVSRYLRKFGIKIRWSKENRTTNCFQNGADNPNWRGGRFFDKRHGYIHINVPGRGYMKEHTIIAEKALGRRLKRGEIVHHIDGDKTNNKNSNLLICDNSYHLWLEKRMAALYQIEHFRT
jgi:transposase